MKRPVDFLCLNATSSFMEVNFVHIQTNFTLHDYRFTCSAVYYGLTIASGDMGGNRYVSVILSAVVEIPSNLIILWIMNLPRYV